MRDEGLIELRGRVLTVLDPEALKQGAGFNSDYLHLRDPGSMTAPVTRRSVA